MKMGLFYFLTRRIQKNINGNNKTPIRFICDGQIYEVSSYYDDKTRLPIEKFKELVCEDSNNILIRLDKVENTIDKPPK
jgi:hypothetical protein